MTSWLEELCYIETYPGKRRKKKKLFFVSSGHKEETKGIHFFLMKNSILIVFASRSAQKETVDYNLLR